MTDPLPQLEAAAELAQVLKITGGTMDVHGYTDAACAIDFAAVAAEIVRLRKVVCYYHGAADWFANSEPGTPIPDEYLHSTDLVAGKPALLMAGQPPATGEGGAG